MVLGFQYFLHKLSVQITSDSSFADLFARGFGFQSRQSPAPGAGASFSDVWLI